MKSDPGCRLGPLIYRSVLERDLCGNSRKWRDKSAAEVWTHSASELCRKEAMESRIQFRTYGEGESIVLLHGFAGSVSHWEPLRPLLAKYYKVIVPNLTHLTLGREALGFSAQIDALARFIKEQNFLRPVHVVGLSYGGALSWGLAIRYPELISRVVLINPMPPHPVQTFQWKALRVFLMLPLTKPVLAVGLRTRWGRGFLCRAAEIFRNVDQAPSLERVESLEGRKLMFVAHLMERFSWIIGNERWDIWNNKLEYWTPETLFICDNQDPLIRFSAYEDLSHRMSCENFFVTEGAGHISPLNSPHMITWEVMKFFLDTTSRSA